jgi:predicted DNA-binding protein (UPF0251 family)
MVLSKEKIESTKKVANYVVATAASRLLETQYKKPKYGSDILALERQRMIGSWIKAGQNIRRGLQPVEASVREGLEALDLRDVTHLTRRQVSEILKVARPQMREATQSAMLELEENLGVSLRRGIRAMNATFRKMGVKPLTKKEAAEVMEASFIQTAKPWPPHSPKTYNQRIENSARVHFQQLKTSLGKQYPKGKVVPGIMRNVYRGLRKLKASGIKGGSYANRLQMILAAEETRITNEVNLRMIQFRGIEFAYWRLSPAHPWYGGGEICEWYASVPYGGSMGDLQKAGLASMDQAGLHSLDNWPSYPHPWCKCYPEPVAP